MSEPSVHYNQGNPDEQTRVTSVPAASSGYTSVVSPRYQRSNLRYSHPEIHHREVIARLKRRHVRRWHMRGWFLVWAFAVSLAVPLAITALSISWRWATHWVLS